MSSLSDNNNPLMAYLRIEADLAVERAKRLTSLIDVLTNGSDSPSTTISNNTKIEDADDLAPLDEFGNPKYKGKKRGRKSTKRKRARDPNKPKKNQTAYTCFIQENYKHIQKDVPDLKAKEVITILAHRWADATEEEKLKYREKAARLARESEVEVEEVEVEELGEDDDAEQMGDISRAVAEAQQEKIGKNGDLNCGEVLKKPEDDMKPPRKKVVHNLLKRDNNDENEEEDLEDDEEVEDW